MVATGVEHSPEALQALTELKARKHKFVIYKMSDDEKSVVLEKTSSDLSDEEYSSDNDKELKLIEDDSKLSENEKKYKKQWHVFCKQLLNVKYTTKTGAEKDGCRYAVYDFEFELPNGEGYRQLAAFVGWVPDSATIKDRMLYAGSKEPFKNALGLVFDIAAHGSDDIEWDTVIKDVKSFKKY